MGRNNRDYKIKDKNLTKNKKNAKLNKSIALTLAGMAAIGAGAAIGGQNQDAQAMMGRVGSAASKIAGGAMTKMPRSIGKISSTKVGAATSRVLHGAPGSINSGRIGSNGTQFAGLPKTSESSGMLNKNTSPTAPKTQTSTLTTTTSTSSSTGSLTSTGGKGTPKLSNVGSLGSKADPFKGGNASSVALKDGGLKQQAYTQKTNTGSPVLTTEGYFRK